MAVRELSISTNNKQETITTFNMRDRLAKFQQTSSPQVAQTVTKDDDDSSDDSDEANKFKKSRRLKKLARKYENTANPDAGKSKPSPVYVKVKVKDSSSSSTTKKKVGRRDALLAQFETNSKAWMKSADKKQTNQSLRF